MDAPFLKDGVIYKVVGVAGVAETPNSRDVLRRKRAYYTLRTVCSSESGKAGRASIWVGPSASAFTHADSRRISTSGSEMIGCGVN